MRGNSVDASRISVVTIGVVDVTLATWIVRDIELLGCEVLDVANAVFVTTRVPDLAGELIANGKGIASFDELDAARGALVDGWRDEDVNVVRHDDESVEGKAALVAIAEESLNHQLGVRGALEQALTLMGEDSDGVGLRLLADRGHSEESIPQGLKPRSIGGPGGPRLKPWVT